MKLVTSWLALCLASTLPALPIDPVPTVHALIGGTIVTAPGQVIELGTVVIRDGLIESVGSSISIPTDAREWDLEGKTVYPGLIESYSARAWPADAAKAEEDAGSFHDNGSIRPERSAARFGIDDATASKLREAGFTTAVVAPDGGLFRGTSALVNLGTGALGENLLDPSVAQNVTLAPGSFDGGYPSSLMGAVALFRQTVMDTRWYREAAAAHRRSPAQPRAPWSSAWPALDPIVSGDQPIVFETHTVLDTLRISRLAKELGLTAIVVGNGREYQRLDAITATGLPHLLPIDFPEPPREQGDSDPNVEIEALRHWDAAPSNPAAVLGTGLTVAFTSHGLSSPKAIHASLAKAVERGLDADDALAALTVTPARLLGIEHTAGTIAPGKMANLVIADGDLFTENTNVTSLWIDGHHIEIRATEPPAVEPAGTWDVIVKTGDGTDIPVQLVLEGAAVALSGTIGAEGMRVELSTLIVSGDSLEIAFDGSSFDIPGTISMDVTIEGDAMSGSGQSPMGPFTVSGHRTSTSTPEVTP